MQLSPEQITSFHNEGFLRVDEPLVPQHVIERLQGIYDRLFAGGAGSGDGIQHDLAGPGGDGAKAALPQIMNPDQYAPELRNDVLEAADGIVKQLLGPAAVAQIYHAILKPAQSGAPTPWHQDEAYYDPQMLYHTVSIWLPLQEATTENGCLSFNRGSHDWEVLEHRSIGGDTRAHGLELVDTHVIDDPVACPLPPGGITIHRNWTAHYAGPNSTAIPRRALIMGANLPPRAYPGQRHFPWNDARPGRREELARLTAANAR